LLAIVAYSKARFGRATSGQRGSCRIVISALAAILIYSRVWVNPDACKKASMSTAVAKIARSSPGRSFAFDFLFKWSTT
jgi:hypothetical protein